MIYSEGSCPLYSLQLSPLGFSFPFPCQVSAFAEAVWGVSSDREDAIAEELQFSLDSQQLMSLYLAEQWYHCSFNSCWHSFHSAALEGKPQSDLLN